MLRYISIVILFICSCLPIWGQEHQWHEPFFIQPNVNGTAKLDMQVDNEGNTYVIALFKDEVIVLDTTLYTSKDDGLFLAKFDINHNLLWSKVIVEAKEATPNITRVIANAYIEITDDFVYSIVEYQDSILLNNQLFTVNQSQTDYQDIAICKITTMGQINDIYHIKGSCQIVYGDMKSDEGYLYFHIRNRRSDLDTDSVCSCEINSDTTLYSEKNDAILGRIDESTGQVDWVKVYDAETSIMTVGKIAVVDSNLYISGYVFTSVDLNIDSNILVVPGIYSRYGYVAKLDIYGEYKWSKYFGVKGWDSTCIPRDLGINSNNDIVVVVNLLTQSVSNQLFFENAPTLTGVSGTNESFIVVNYDSLGNVKWHDISHSLGHERMISVDFDSDKNMYLAGSFTTDITFGSQYIEGYGFSNDILIISYDSLGNKRWAQKAGGFGSDLGGFISIDSSDILHVGGFITASSATFGVHETNPPSSGTSIFVAQMRLEPIGLNETTPQQFAVSVYPNPSLGNTHIEIQDEFISQIRVYNGLGQEIQILNFENQTSQASIENLVSGYYIIDIHSLSGKHVSQKLIVQ